MTPAERAREIVMRALAGATWYEVADQPDWQKRVTDLVAPAIRHALAAQAAELDDAQFAARAARQTLTAYAAKYDALAAQTRALSDAAEMLWTVVANVSGGDWTQQSPEWQEAAARWRDAYFAALTGAPREEP